MGKKWGFSLFARDVAIGAVIWLLITTAVGQARFVPSGSMEPTIKPGDRLWIERVTLAFTPIERGDIVIFSPPIPSDTPYVKRVIGLPGETVLIRDGLVWVNEKPLAESYIAESPNYQYGPVPIPEGFYLVLGDNRNNSLDSHIWGLVPRESITARAALRVWPMNRIGFLN